MSKIIINGTAYTAEQIKAATDAFLEAIEMNYFCAYNPAMKEACGFYGYKTMFEGLKMSKAELAKAIIVRALENADRDITKYNM